MAAQNPGSGIEKVEGIEYLEDPPAEYLDSRGVEDAYGHGGYLEGYYRVEALGGLLPGGVKWGVRYRTFVVNSPVYCAYLLRKFVLNGGQMREYTLVDLREAFYLAENVKTVVNCSGMGFNDPRSFIIRGVSIAYLP